MDAGLKEIYAAIGDSDANQDVSDWLSTGVLPLNHAISGNYWGGFPVGRITEIYGGESSGKTLMATNAMIETQKKGGIAVMQDFEHAFSLSRAEELGLNIDPRQWIYKQPATAEEGFTNAEKICNIVRKHDTEKQVTIVFDSIASMVPKAALEAGFDDANMKTRLALAVCMSTSLPLLAGIISKTNVSMIFLNQTRDNPGIMFGNKESTPGGKAMKFYASLRIKLSKTGKIKDGERILGETVNAQTIKNKVYRPFEVCEYNSSFETGIDLETTHIKYLDSLKMLGSSSGYVEFDGKKRRVKELARMCREDEATYARLLDIFKEIKA